MNQETSIFKLTVASTVLCLGLGLAAVAQEKAPGTPPRLRLESWPKEVLRLFSTLPVQDQGRIKPLSTVASYKLLDFNHKRSFTTDWKERLTPTAWLLDCLFFPEQAQAYEIFLLPDSSALDLLGLDIPGKRKRDRYAYAELQPASNTIFQKGQSYSRMQANVRSRLQQQILELASDFSDFELLSHALDFARGRYATAPVPALQQAFPGKTELRFGEMLSRMPELLKAYNELAPGHGQPDAAKDKEKEVASKAFLSVLMSVQEAGMHASALALFPPAKPDDDTWQSAADLSRLAFDQHQLAQEQLLPLLRLQALVDKRNQPPAFQEELLALHQDLVARAGARGEYDKIELEVSYYAWDYFFHAKFLFLIGALLTALCWLLRKSGARTVLNWGAWGCLGSAELLLIAGIVVRGILRSRPPVSTLYESILFIAAVLVLVAMVLEFFFRYKVAQFLLGMLGAFGLFMADRHEIGDGTDTMPKLQAVLDTNFWLATHVTTITIGYAAGLLAGAIAHVYILCKLFGWQQQNREFFRSLSKMVYGVTCFGLLFAIVGTILGGIWANYSWGRFWGWDPKENGALLIVLGQLIILHGRMGGYLREFGIPMASIGVAVLVGFSWWYVNLMGVGLHAYGFSADKLLAVVIFFIVEGVFLVLGTLAWFLDQHRKAGLKTAGPQSGSQSGSQSA